MTTRIICIGDDFVSRIRAIFVYFFVLLAEGGLVYMAKEPLTCTGTIFIMNITGGNQLNVNVRVRHLAHITVGVICLLACIGLLLMAIDLIGGKSKGLLKFAYMFMAVYHLIQITACIYIYTATNLIQTNRQKANILVYFIAECLLLIVMALYILRELGLMRYLDKLSAVLLLPIIGQIVSNGLLTGKNVKMALLHGFITALPTIAIFVFEAFILEASIRRQR